MYSHGLHVLYYNITKYIPPTIQFVLGKGCFKCYKIPPMDKNAIKSSKMLIKSLAKFRSVKWIFSWQNLFC